MRRAFPWFSAKEKYTQRRPRAAAVCATLLVKCKWGSLIETASNESSSTSRSRSPHARVRGPSRCDTNNQNKSSVLELWQVQNFNTRSLSARTRVCVFREMYLWRLRSCTKRVSGWSLPTQQYDQVHGHTFKIRAWINHFCQLIIIWATAEAHLSTAKSGGSLSLCDAVCAVCALSNGSLARAHTHFIKYI